MLHLSSLNTSEYILKDRSAATLLHGTLKHTGAMMDSFGNCCAAANQRSAGWGVALSSPALDRYARSSVFAFMSSSNHGMFLQINSWVTVSIFNLATSNAWHTLIFLHLCCLLMIPIHNIHCRKKNWVQLHHLLTIKWSKLTVSFCNKMITVTMFVMKCIWGCVEVSIFSAYYHKKDTVYQYQRTTTGKIRLCSRMF